MEIPKPIVYTAKNGSQYEIFCCQQRTVADMEARILRHQIYCGENTFGLDVFMSNQNIQQFQLNDSQINQVSIMKICYAIDEGITEYCMLELGEKDILEYRQKLNGSHA